jgi:hypothetical protein
MRGAHRESLFGIWCLTEWEWMKAWATIYIYIWTKVICYIRIVLKCFFNILKKIKKIIFNNNILKQFIYKYYIKAGKKTEESKSQREMSDFSVLSGHTLIYPHLHHASVTRILSHCKYTTEVRIVEAKHIWIDQKALKAPIF